MWWGRGGGTGGAGGCRSAGRCRCMLHVNVSRVNGVDGGG